mmetsp:Transcript_18635/g.26408  ORF Transcript_18635/g.26408 Transcript_18635/m.26408 type:complete len:576 (-) Transcript_18635:187-1914(-)
MIPSASTTSIRRSGGRPLPSMGTLFPILIVIAFVFYTLGFIQSIRNLPDINGSDMFFTAAGHDALRRAVLPLYQKVQQRKVKKTPTTTTTIPRDNNNNNNKREFIKDEDIDSKSRIKSQLKRMKEPAAVKVPEAKWPVTIRDEPANFETIIHPGDGKTEMSVPKFWSDPLMTPTGPLMSRETALQVGSTTDGDRENVNSRTIFIAIASYRDYQCKETLDSIFTRAKYPNRVRVAIVDQIEDGVDTPCNTPFQPCTENPNQTACKYKGQIDDYEMEAELAIGPVFARHIGHRMYRGEYYTMQVDAHVTFAQDWDTDIVMQLEATQNDMAVLSTYLSDISGALDPATGYSRMKTRPIMCNTDYETDAQGAHLRHKSQPERVPTIQEMPQMQPYWAAGFSFSRGHFVVNVPYDLYQPMIFQGEESSIGIRAFTYGYDHYAPQRSICFHTYASGHEERNKVPHFWQHAAKYAGTGKKAMVRLLGLIGMLPEVDPETWDHREEERYGAGSVRSLEKFFTTFGIDVHRKRCQRHLCSFVQAGKMHRDFQKYLRPDGMGIDYNNIDYTFTDPSPDSVEDMLE